MELFNKLTSKHKSLEETWSSFMFNLEELKMIKLLKVDFDKLLLAGSRYLGKGWTPERARERLLELSGCFLVEPKLASYLQTLIHNIALVTDASLPPLPVSQEATAAAFTLAATVQTQSPTVGKKAWVLDKASVA